MKNNSRFEWESCVCNICGRRNLESFLSDVSYWEFDIKFLVVRCKNCNLVFLNPRPAKRDIHYFYKSESYWGKDIKEVENEDDSSKEREAIYGPIYKIALKRKSGKILDIGAGIGLFLTKFKEKGWETEGVEYSRDAVNYASKHNKIMLKSGDFLDFDYEKQYFDLVTLNNSLEHLYNPLETLRKVNKVLKMDGALIITVPNIDSLGFKLFGKSWYPLQPPIHLYHFSPNTLEKILNNAGFRVIKVDHNFPTHSYFSLFESFRSIFKNRDTEIKTKRKQSRSLNGVKHKNYIKEAGIITGKIFAYTVSFIGSKTKHGESIIVYAKKS